MKIICVGLWKTGTKSLTKALKILGFSVYDAHDNLLYHLDHWLDILENRIQPNAKQLYDNIDAVVGTPIPLFFEEILEAYSDAKVVLTIGDEEEWILSLVEHMKLNSPFLCARWPFSQLVGPTLSKARRVIPAYTYAMFGSINPSSTNVFRKRYRTHNSYVKSVVSDEKLLLFNVNQGWEPLCDFLGRDVPPCPFPHENKKGAYMSKSLQETKLSQKMDQECWRRAVVFVSVIMFILAIAMFYFVV